MASFFLVIVYLSFDFFVGVRLLNIFNLKSKSSKIIYWTLFIFLSLSFFLSYALSNIVPYNITKGLNVIGSLYLGLFFYLAIFFTISYLVTKILRLNKINLYIPSLFIVLLLFFFGIYSANNTKFRNYDIQLDTRLSNSDSIKIAMISDIHLGYVFDKKHLSQMVSELNKINADVIIIAGDLIDSDLDPVIEEDMIPLLKELKSTYGTYIALGNHDCYTENISKLTKLLEDNKVTVLNDEYTLINNDFYIIGRIDEAITDYGGSRKSLADIIKNTNDSKPKIVIEHVPDSIDEAILNNINLMLSGHTHNGQVFPLNLVISLLYKLSYGYEKFNNTHVVVSSGYGTWGPPVRLGKASEISIITLHN